MIFVRNYKLHLIYTSSIYEQVALNTRTQKIQSSLTTRMRNARPMSFHLTQSSQPTRRRYNQNLQDGGIIGTYSCHGIEPLFNSDSSRPQHTYRNRPMTISCYTITQSLFSLLVCFILIRVKTPFYDLLCKLYLRNGVIFLVLGILNILSLHYQSSAYHSEFLC